MLPLLPFPGSFTGSLPFSLTNFHEISEVKQLRLIEHALLQESNLFRVDIPRASLLSSNVLKAVSYSLYLTPDFDEFLGKLCLDTLSRLLTQAIESSVAHIGGQWVPKRLRIFYNNHQLFTDFSMDPTSPKFSLLILELISSIFQARIVIYELDDFQYLRSTILNNSHEYQLLFFKDRFGQFDIVESLPFMQKFMSLREMVLEILDESLNARTRNRNKRRDSDRLFEELNRDIENEINTPLPVVTELQPKEKPPISSNSLDMMEKTTNDLTAEKHCNDQVFFRDGFQEFKLGRPRENSDLLPPKKTIGRGEEKPEGDNQKLRSFQECFGASNGKANNNNPFALQPSARISQTESPKFNSFAPIVDDAHQSVGFREKKAKSIALKCTSEEFIIPMRSLQERKSVTPQPYPFKKQPLVLEESKEKFMGTLKFFDEVKGYGFLIMDVDNSEIFVHFDDFVRSQGVTREMLMTYKLGNIIRVSFTCMKYIGKYNMSRKAVEVQITSTSF